MIFQQEDIRKIRAEIEPHLETHWRDARMFDDLRLEVDWEMYFGFAETGRLYTYTARLETLELVGYQNYVVINHQHYKSEKVGQQISLFLHPDHRRGRMGINFIKYAEKRMIEAGITMIMQHTKKRRDLTRMLEMIGYEVTDIVLTKRV